MHLNLSFIKNNFPDICFLNLPTDLSFKVDISIDSRTIKKGQFYLSLKGERFDGHDFINHAIKNGAVGLIVSESNRDCFSSISQRVIDEIVIIIVPDTHKFICDLAFFWRQSFEIPIVGITGSVGKTTTKQMLKHILDLAKIKSFVSFKNQNNLIGLPLNILKLNDEHKAAIFELGISVKGEMDQLVSILRPTISVITHICSAHTEGLGNLHQIAEEKFKIFKYLKSDEIGILWGDQKDLNKSFTHPVVKFGGHRTNHIQSRRIKINSTENSNISVSFDLHFYNEKRKVTLNVGNSGFVNNALAAATVAHFLNIDLQTIIDGLESYPGFEGRFERKKLKNGRGILINDCYNASPQSMKVAIESFDQIQFDQIDHDKQKIAILGDMLELGQKQIYWHRYIGKLLAKSKSINYVILVGSQSKIISGLLPFAIKVFCAKTWQEAEKEYLKLTENKETLTLVKASHGVELYNLVKNVVEKQ